MEAKAKRNSNAAFCNIQSAKCFLAICLAARFPIGRECRGPSNVNIFAMSFCGMESTAWVFSIHVTATIFCGEVCENRTLHQSKRG